MPIVSAPRRALGKRSTRPRSLVKARPAGVIVFTRVRANCRGVRGCEQGRAHGALLSTARRARPRNRRGGEWGDEGCRRSAFYDDRVAGTRQADTRWAARRAPVVAARVDHGGLVRADPQTGKRVPHDVVEADGGCDGWEQRILAASEPDGRGEVTAGPRGASLDDAHDAVPLDAARVDLIGDRACGETGLGAVADSVPDDVDHSGGRERSLRGRHEPSSGADDDRRDLAERVTLVEVVVDDVDVLHAPQGVAHSDDDARATCAANHVPFEERVGVASHLYPEHLRKRRWLVRDRAVHKALAYDQPRALP